MKQRRGGADAPIGVFDSGVGGLTVLKEVMHRLPNERCIYFGDTARLPYGNKSRDTVIRYSTEIATFLVQRQVKLIIVACNTASSHALPALSAQFPHIPILGVIEPGAQAAWLASKNKKIGIVGTKGTIASKAHATALRALDPEIEVYPVACPLFVPLVEEKWEDHPAASLIVEEYLAPLRGKVDTLLLGCTHYPFLRAAIQHCLGDAVCLVDPSVPCADQVERTLRLQSLLAHSSRGHHEFYLSDEGAASSEIAALFLGRPVSFSHWRGEAV